MTNRMGGTEALYEGYKDALRRGHIAALRGQLDEALLAYEEAASIAPDRPLPLASAGAALARSGRHADALARYDAALQLAPRDEVVLLGRAECLAGLGRRGDAADAFDALAAVHAARARLADAVEAARRGLELAEGRLRRRDLERLIERLRATEPDAPGRAALERALSVLEAGAGSGPMTRAAGVGAAGPADAGDVAAVDPGEAEPAEDLAALSLAAEEALDGGDAATARQRLLVLARSQRRAGNLDAALDACFIGLSLAPDDVDLHLALAELYADRGWPGLAGEKLERLARLAELDGDSAVAERIAAARSGTA